MAIVRKKRRANVVGGTEDQDQQSVRRKRRKPVPRNSAEDEYVESVNADDVLDEIEEQEQEEEATQTLLFASSEVISEEGLRFWGKRSALQNLVASARAYTSSQVSAARYMSEVTIHVVPGKDDEKYISATGESEFDAGQFFLFDDFQTSATEEFWFSIDPNHLATALDIISGDSVTIELVYSEDDDDDLADLWILDSTSNGQNTNFKVVVPDEDNQPHVPEGILEERIEFQPESWLSAYAEVERCRGEETVVSQVFSSIDEEDGQPFIRFSATDRFHAATSRAWLDEREGEKLSKINFHPDAINKALPYMSDGVVSRMMVSTENEDSLEEDTGDEYDYDEPTQTSQLVILETLDERARTLSKIKLSTLVPSMERGDYEAAIVDKIHSLLDLTTVLVSVNYAQLSQAIANADRVHSLNPESESDRSRLVHLVLDGDTITVRSHNVNRPDFGTKSSHTITELDDSGKHNEDFGQRDIIGLITTQSLNIIDRFRPNHHDDEAVLAFFKNEGDEHLKGLFLLRKDEAEEWNEDDDYPKFVTSIFGSSDSSIYDND